MSTLKTSDLEDMTGLSQRYWQRRIANGEVPCATEIACGPQRRFLLDADTFSAWWATQPEAMPTLKRKPLPEQKPAPLAAKGEAVIYFIRSGRHVKVGHTTNLPKRLSELQTGNPEPCFVEKVIAGTKGQEEALHRHLCELGFQSRGEWYSWTKDIYRASRAFVEGST